MLTRIVLAGVSVAALAGGTTTVFVTAAGNEQGIAQRASRAGEAQAATHGKSADAAANGADAAEDTGAEAAKGAADVQLPPCPADVKNHGAYVSSVAKTPKDDAAEPGAHGALVSAAAQSDCGKPAGAADGDDADENETAAEKAANDAAKAERKAGKSGEAGKSGTHGKSSDAPGKAGATPGQASSTP